MVVSRCAMEMVVKARPSVSSKQSSVSWRVCTGSAPGAQPRASPVRGRRKSNMQRRKANATIHHNPTPGGPSVGLPRSGTGLHHALRLVVQGAGGLVQEQRLRLARQRAGDGHALPLAAREHATCVFAQRLDTEAIQTCSSLDTESRSPVVRTDM